MAKEVYNIESFEDLKFAREQIKKDNKNIELSIKENPILKISSSLLGGGAILKILGGRGGGSVKNTFINNLSSGNRQSGSQIIRGLLLANKATRKYFVGYTIASKMIPYTLHKISGLLNKR